MKQTAVEWIEGYLKKFNHIEESLSLKKAFDQAKAMEKEQSECICVNVIQRILNESEQGKEINSKQIFENVYNETFKSE